jgi:predicted metal-binding membrane protein
MDSPQEACLSYCQAPLTFIMRHGGFRGDTSGALTLGLRHGIYCIGCCWALMALLFVVGIMNLLWIAALAVLVLLEKLSRQAESSRALLAVSSWRRMDGC